MSAEFRELAIVGRRLNEPLTGVGRYIECLLREWRSGEHPFGTIRVYAPGQTNLPPDVLEGPIAVEIVPQNLSPLYWENVQLPSRLKHADVIFAPYTLPWFSARRGVVSNLGIYDGRPGDFPLAARLRTTPFFRHAARSAIRVIANSHSTRDDLVRHYGVSPDKVDVILLGADSRLSPGDDQQPLPAEIKARYGLSGAPYFLLVGKLSKRRNIPLLIEAFAEARPKLTTDHQLVVIGPDYLGLSPRSLAHTAGVGEAVAHAPFAPMDDLLHLYRGATAFVLPTEHEGFSLTIPEAMACGAPVITFDHAALEGPLHDSAWIVEPNSSALALALRQIVNEPAVRNQWRERALLCARHYRWETTAQQTMRILGAAATQLRRK
ncbi:MAG: glycosyltransferase family 1 protein [Acidobacteria bacterium]|nr:glycosyltransferase family 1 protein [Acidobacteriota bacterium]MDA1235286.1 glycosyltransferase family 1 protein [Acidobacteriota bacterium]